MGRNIKANRLEKGIPPKELASMLQITPQALGDIENGKVKDIGISKLVEISTFLQIHYSQLLSIEKNIVYNISITKGAGGVHVQTAININGEADEKVVEQIVKAINTETKN